MIYISGDPALAIAGEGARPEDVENIRKFYGFDRPIIVQYADWLKNAVQGDLGRSYNLRQPVADVIFERLPVTMLLGACAISFALLLAIPLGVLAAVRPNSIFDRAALTLAVGLRAHSYSRRRLLQLVSLLMVVTGIGFALFEEFWLLALVGLIGTLNPSGGDVSVFLPTEQALLPATVDDRDRTELRFPANGVERLLILAPAHRPDPALVVQVDSLAADGDGCIIGLVLGLQPVEFDTFGFGDGGELGPPLRVGDHEREGVVAIPQGRCAFRFRKD